MNTIAKRSFTAFMLLLFLGSIPTFGQSFKEARWSRVKMDSAYDYSKGKSTKVINEHIASSPSMLKPIGKSDKKLEYTQLSELATNVLLDYASQRLARATKNPQAKADLSIIFFRDKKVSLPAGDITPNDVFSLFPMDNKVIVVSLKGEYIQKLIKDSAKKGAVLSQWEEPINNDRIYKVVTIDFLFKKENCAYLLECAEKLEDCNTPLSNTLIQHIKRW